MSRWLGRVGSGGAGSSFGNLTVGGVVYIADGAAATPSIALSSDTDTGLYSPSTGQIAIANSGAERVLFAGTTVTFNAHVRPSSDNTRDLGHSSYTWKDFYLAGNANIGGAQLMTEMTAPSGTANKATIYAVDNGSGKTQLMVIFGTGAAQQIAIEP